MKRVLENQENLHLKQGEVTALEVVDGEVRGVDTRAGVRYRGTTVVLTTGTYGNVFRFLPPLTMPEHLLEEALTILARGLEATA